MKKLILIATTLCVSQIAFAQTPSETPGIVQSGLVSVDQQTPSMVFKGLPADAAGKTATLFFVSGRENTLTMSGRTLKVRSVKQVFATDPANLISSLRATVSADGTVTFPAVNVPRTGFDLANYIVLTTRSDAGEIYLKNADGTCPADLRLLLSDRTCSDLTPNDFRVDSNSFALLDGVSANKDHSGRAIIDFNQMER